METEKLSFLYIIPASCAYTGGEILQGEILMKLTEALDCDSLKLRLSGVEFFEIDKNNKTESGSHVIISEEQVLYSWPNGRIEKGDFVFPFKISLPIDLPGSTTLDIREVKAFIEYKLHASLTHHLSCSTEIKIKSNLPFPNTANEIFRQVPIRSCYCINKGTEEINVSANKYEYLIGDIVKIRVDCDREKFSLIECRMFRTIFLNTSSGVIVQKDLILRTDVQSEKLDLDLKALESRITNQSSTKGKLICCMYSLNFSGSFNFCCSNSLPDLDLSINIFTSQGLLPHFPTYSVPWGPKVLKNSLNESNFEDDNYF